MKKIFTIFILFGILAFTSNIASGQIDVLNKGKNLIKDKTKNNDNNNQNNNQNENINNNQNNQGNSNELTEDCNKARTRCGYDLDYANQYADKSDWGQVDFNLEKVEDNIKFIKENCPSMDVSDLESKVKAVRDKKLSIENNASKEEARWNKDGDWMQGYKDWAYQIIDFYLGSADSKSTLERVKNFAEVLGTREAYEKKKMIADSIIEQWPVEKLNYSTLWSNYTFSTSHFMNMWNDRLNSGFNGYLKSCMEEIDLLKTGETEPYLLYCASEKMYIVSSAATAFGDPEGKLSNFLSDSKAYKEKYLAEMKTKIYTSDFHAKNAEKIVFSNSPIIIKQENQSSLKTEFKAGESIYAMVYSNYVLDYPTTIGQIYIDDMDKPKFAFEYDFNRNSTDTYFAMDIVPTVEGFRQVQSYEWTRLLSELTPRVHKIAFELAIDFRSYAKGEITVDCSQNIDQWVSLSSVLKGKVIDIARMPIAKLKNTTLEQSMLNAFKKDNPGVTAYRVVILDPDWGVYKNEYTEIIEYRSIFAAIAVKNTDGKYYVYNDAIFKQVYTGSGYGPIEYIGSTESYEIRYENINK